MDNLERKFGRYAIRNLTMVMIIMYAIGFMIAYLKPSLLYMVTLNPYAIMHGQIWRLVSWLLVLPGYSSVFSMAIMLFCYYSIGNALERIWGTWKYNVFILRGMLLMVVSAFLWMGFYYLTAASSGIDTVGAQTYISMYSIVFSTYYINLGIIVAFALTMPDAQFLLFFLVPIKAKYIALLDLAYLAYGFVTGNAPVRFAVAATAVNLLIFWLERNGGLNGLRAGQRRRAWRAAAGGERQRGPFAGNTGQGRNPGAGAGPVHARKQDLGGRSGSLVHRCAICGRTNVDHPELEFRFCSKCEGGLEYCQDHLFTHKHVKAGERPSPLV